MSLAGSLFINPRVQFSDGDGVPYAGGKLYAFVAGTSTPQDTYSDSALTTPNTNPVILDADGRLGAVFLSATGYKFRLDDANDVTIFTADNCSDPAAVFVNALGDELATGSEDVTGTYNVLATDLFITCDTSGGDVTINLQAASARTQPLGIKNLSTGQVVVNVNGADTIDNALASFTMSAASSPTFPSIWLLPKGNDNYLIAASHGL